MARETWARRRRALLALQQGRSINRTQQRMKRTKSFYSDRKEFVKSGLREKRDTWAYTVKWWKEDFHESTWIKISWTTFGSFSYVPSWPWSRQVKAPVHQWEILQILHIPAPRPTPDPVCTHAHLPASSTQAQFMSTLLAHWKAFNRAML